MNKVLEHLKKETTTVIFDIDGTLAVFDFGELRHNACKQDIWNDYIFHNNPYENAKPVPQVQSFIKEKGVDQVYVCSVSTSFAEDEYKIEFVNKHYGIPKEHVFFVNDKIKKIDVLRKISLKENKKGIDLALVEDTTSTLDQIYENTSFCTVHISSFFLYD